MSIINEFANELYRQGAGGIPPQPPISYPHSKTLNAEIEQVLEPQTEKGFFTVKPANEWIEQAKNRPTSKMLFGKLWFENELCILFADTNLGKSILAVQIGNSISKGETINGFDMEAEKQQVLYFDFELSDKQFETRYSDNFINHYLFDDNFIRIEVNPNSDIPAKIDYETYLNQELERVISETGAKVIIIDNLTYLRSGTETARDALPLMKHLKALKSKYNLSILVLAHTPKRDLSKPITRNDLQGSKMLINFCDSSFAIGESFTDKSLRYIKQIKQRNCEMVYDANNVGVCEIAKPTNLLHFEFLCYGIEREHLRVPSEKDRSELEANIKQLKTDGKSIRDISKELNISKSKVDRLLKK
jgi:hypothetical protein